MNHKKKLGYMAIGAGILAIGITIGQWTTPDIEAQNNGVFDEIICRSLQVVDESGEVFIASDTSGDERGLIFFNSAGNQAIQIGVWENGNDLRVYDKAGKLQVAVQASEGESGVTVYDKAGKLQVAVQAVEGGNGVVVYDKAGKPAVHLVAAEDGNRVGVYDKAGKPAVRLEAVEDGNMVTVSDKTGEIGILLSEFESTFEGENVDGAVIVLKGKAGEESIFLGTTEKRGNMIRIINRAGNVSWQAP